MSFDKEQILQDYIARLLTMQDAREEWLSETDLQAAARDLGLSDEDLKRLDAVTEGHRQRGKNFAQHDAWSEAIAEYRQATILDPFDVPLLYELAVAHASRWEAAHDDADREAAERYARRCIELDPAFQPAYTLLKALNKPSAGQAAPQASRRALVLGLLGVSLLMMGVMMFFLARKAEPPSPPPIVAPPPTPTGPGDAARTEAQIPVRLVDEAQAQGLLLEVQSSTLNRYEASFSYTLKATVRNATTELHRLRMKMVLLDADGAVLQTKYFDGLSDHEPYLRPGDTFPLSELIYEEQPAPPVHEVHLSTDLVEREPAAAAYDPPTPLPLTWEFTQPAHLDITVFERESRVTEGLREPMHFLTLGIRNNSTRPVQHLRLKVTWLDTQDAVITSELSYVVSSSGPAMRAGEVWIDRAIGTLRAGVNPPYARYTVSVAEAE